MTPWIFTLAGSQFFTTTLCLAREKHLEISVIESDRSNYLTRASWAVNQNYKACTSPTVSLLDRVQLMSYCHLFLPFRVLALVLVLVNCVESMSAQLYSRPRQLNKRTPGILIRLHQT